MLGAEQKRLLDACSSRQNSSLTVPWWKKWVLTLRSETLTIQGTEVVQLGSWFSLCV